MKNVKLKLAVLGALSVVSAQAMANLVSLPAAGLSVSAGTNQVAGTTGYVECNTTGNYGTGTPTAPTSSSDPCHVIPASSNGNNPPPSSQVGGVTFSSVSAPANVTVTANSETLATLVQRVFRNSANTQCLYLKRLQMATTGTYDYNPQLTGSNRLEVNDIALGGFSSTTNVLAGYWQSIASDSPVFRMGRAFTAVQMQADPTNDTLIANGFIRRPVNSPAPAASTEINGVGQTASSTGTPPGADPGTVTPTAAQQTAEIRTNWVNFTLDITGGVDEDGDTEPNSPFLYVSAGCTSAAPVTTANTIRIRQTGQETQPFVTILTSGQTRTGANANF